MTDPKRATTCVCSTQGCWRGSEEGIPPYCQANRFTKEIEKAKQAYRTAELSRLYRASCEVGAVSDGYRARIEEAIDFARRMNFSKIGFAACTAFSRELRIITKLFTVAGLEVVAAACAIGRISAEERGMPELGKYVNSTCNPLAQAEILITFGTQLNFTVGLFLGHAILIGLLAFFLDGSLDFRPLIAGRMRWLRLGPTLILAIAAFEEVAQILSPNRTASLKDFVGDLLGICVCSWAAKALATRRASSREV